MTGSELSQAACSGDRLLIGSDRPEEGWFYTVNRVVLGLVLGLYFRVTATGRRYIPLEGPVILAANHASFVDPPLVGLMCPRAIVTLAKQELWRVPLMRLWMNALGCIPVARGTADFAALRAAVEVLQRGKALLLFPEGTRSYDGKVAAIHRGVAWIACRSRAVVVPTFIGGSFHAFSRHRRIPRPHRISVRFGVPIPPPAISHARSANLAAFAEDIQRALRELETRYEKETFRDQLPSAGNPAQFNKEHRRL